MPARFALGSAVNGILPNLERTQNMGSGAPHLATPGIHLAAVELDVKIEQGIVPWWPNALLTVTSLIESQEFPVAGGPIYEGVARASGTFNGQPVSGTAWNEQTGR